MSRSIRFVLALIIGVAVNAAAGPPQENVRPVPAATFSEFHCTGFISSSQMPATIRVFNGADNDFDEALQEFTSKDYIYLRRTDHQVFHVGDAYSIIRSETGFLLNPAWLPGKIQNQILPPASAYPFQRYDIKKLGWPYDNTGLVRVVKLTPQGAIAKVVFTCNGIYPQDIAVPYQPKPIPFFIPNTRLDRFALPNGKLQGIIVADSTASDILARGSIAFLNIGRTQGVAASQRYHIFAISRQVPVKGLEGLFGRPQSPRETIGELVILHVRQKSSVGVIVNSLRQIAIGDGVELE